MPPFFYSVSHFQKILIDAGHAGEDYNSITHTYNGNQFTYSESQRIWALQEYLIQALKNIGFINTERLRATNNFVTTDGPVSGQTWGDWNEVEETERGKRATGFDLFIQLHSNAADNANADHALVVGRPNTVTFVNSLAEAIKNTMKLVGNSNIITTDYLVVTEAIKAGCPLSFLTENSFHTNARAAYWLMQDENLLKLAKAYAKVIKNHFIP